MALDDFDELNSSRSWFLADLCEPWDNSLEFTITEGIVSSTPENIKVLNTVLEACYPIVINEASRRYRISFNEYVAYNILNESYGMGDPQDPQRGKRYRIYDSSPYLDYLQATSYASNDFPGPLKDYCFICENHVVNVVAIEAPNIERIAPGDRSADETIST